LRVSLLDHSKTALLRLRGGGLLKIKKPQKAIQRAGADRNLLHFIFPLAFAAQTELCIGRRTFGGGSLNFVQMEYIFFRLSRQPAQVPFPPR